MAEKYLSISGLTYYDQRLKEYFKVDDALNSASTYPVENKAIYFELQNYVKGKDFNTFSGNVHTIVTNLQSGLTNVSTGLTNVYNSAVTYTTEVYDSAVTFTRIKFNECHSNCDSAIINLASEITSSFTYTTEVYNSAVTYVQKAIEDHHNECDHATLSVIEENGLYRDEDSNSVGVHLASEETAGTITKEWFAKIKKLLDLEIDIDIDLGIMSMGGKLWQLTEYKGEEEVISVYYGSTDSVPTSGNEIKNANNSDMLNSTLTVTPDTGSYVSWVCIPEGEVEIAKWSRIMRGVDETLSLSINEGDYTKGNEFTIDGKTYTIYYLQIIIPQGSENKIELRKKQ